MSSVHVDNGGGGGGSGGCFGSDGERRRDRGGGDRDGGRDSDRGGHRQTGPTSNNRHPRQHQCHDHHRQHHHHHHHHHHLPPKPLTRQEFEALSVEDQVRHIDALREQFQAMPLSAKAYVIEASRRLLEEGKAQTMQESPASPERTHVQPAACTDVMGNAEPEGVITIQPTEDSKTGTSAGEKRVPAKRTVSRGKTWKKVRSLHFKSGHWSSPIRFDRTEWKSYATTDSTFGPWCETLTLLSIDVRRVRRKEGALDLVDSIVDVKPEFCALEGVGGAFASMLMKHNGIRKSYWVHLGDNLTSPSQKLKQVGSIIILSRIPPVEAKVLDIGFGIEALLCDFVVNGASLRIASTSTKRCDQDVLDFEGDKCERREEVKHLLKMTGEVQKASASASISDLILLGDCGCPCQQNLEIQTPNNPEDPLADKIPQPNSNRDFSRKLYRVAGKIATRKHGEGAWMTCRENWTAIECKESKYVDNFDSDEYCAIAVKINSKMQRPISVSPESQTFGLNQPESSIDSDCEHSDACLIC